MSTEIISRHKLIPSAHLLLSSLRSVGYTVETAVADIIDNSITAKATEIGVVFDWQNRKIIIYDNGYGMPGEELIQSMAIGSSDPDKARDFYDLGRFGMGMKTAAFSLGKCLTVVSKNNDMLSNACWDLNYISTHDDWNLIIRENTNEDIAALNNYLTDYSTGTVICITDIDKVISSDNYEKEKRRFFKMIDSVKSHLALVFHRFIEEDNLIINVNGGTAVSAWNPFVKGNLAVQELGEETLYNDDKKIVIRPYVLPHKSKFKHEEDFKLAGGYKGWLHHQGFYVYRNRRLIIFGTWFGIFKKETTYNLARIQLDIYSDSDFDWQIDIKKSKAIPPTYAEDAIRRAAEHAANQSMKVYNSRGTYNKRSGASAPQLSCVWEQRKDSRGIYTFFLNKKHTLLNKLKSELNSEQKETLSAYLQLIEKCSPMILSGVSDTMNTLKQENTLSSQEHEELTYNVKALVKALKANGYEDNEIIDLISQISEYSAISDEIENIVTGCEFNG